MTAVPRIGIVGTGRIVLDSYLPVLRSFDDVVVSDVCDLDPDRLARATGHAPEPAAGHAPEPAAGHAPEPAAGHAPEPATEGWSDAEKMLERADLDGVLVATPTDRHADFAVRALERGLPVLLEKPMAPTLHGADRILDAQRASGAPLQVCYVYRYSPLIRRLVDLVHAGDIGQPFQAWAHEFRAAFYGTWRYDAARSGGALLEKMCHHTDVVGWLFADQPAQVHALGGQHTVKAGATAQVAAVDGSTVTVEDSSVVDHAWVQVGYRGGAIASFGMNLLCPYGFHGRDPADLEGLEIGVIGDRGVARAHVRRGVIEVRDADTGAHTTHELPQEHRAAGWHSGTAEQLRAFVDVVRGDAEPFADGHVGREGMRVPLAAERSIRDRAVVTLDD